MAAHDPVLSHRPVPSHRKAAWRAFLAGLTLISMGGVLLLGLGMAPRSADAHDLDCLGVVEAELTNLQRQIPRATRLLRETGGRAPIV